jgi:hypothetical protein
VPLWHRQLSSGYTGLPDAVEPLRTPGPSLPDNGYLWPRLRGFVKELLFLSSGCACWADAALWMAVQSECRCTEACWDRLQARRCRLPTPAARPRTTLQERPSPHEKPPRRQAPPCHLLHCYRNVQQSPCVYASGLWLWVANPEVKFSKQKYQCYLW